MTIDGIEVCVERKDIKNTHLAVYPPDARVHVSAPLRLSDDDIRSFVLSKWTWLAEARAGVLSQSRQSVREYVSGESHYLFGTRYRLKVVARETSGHCVSKTAGTIRMEVGKTATPRFKESILWEWYREQLSACLTKMMPRLADEYGEPGVSWQVKRMKNRWGSCVPSKRSIIFNAELARVPVECIEYIIVHELTHLKVGNHDRMFTKLMDVRCPGWRNLRQRLNAFIALSDGSLAKGDVV